MQPDQSGLYEWRIEGVGCYIGQYTHLHRPKREYWLNVEKLRVGRPYRRSNPTGFRAIHKALHQAASERRSITLLLLENEATKIGRNKRERELIADRRAEAARGGLPVL